MSTPLSQLEPWLAARLGTDVPVRPEVLDAWRVSALRRTLAQARACSPYQARRLAGVDIESFRSLTDLARLPLLTAEDLRGHGLGLMCVSQDGVARTVSLPTSGTTGPAKRLFFSEADLERTVDFFHHGMSGIAVPSRTTLILLPGSNPDGVCDLLARGLRRLGADSLLPGPDRTPDAILDRVAKRNIACVVGGPVAVLALAEHAARRGHSLRPASVLLSTDYVPETLVRRLENLWGCRVFRHYGLTETGYGGAVECQARAGAHIRAADLLFEIIAPATGAVLPPGEWGEIVLTTLDREAMPLIRYRTGDLGRLLPGPCPCGSAIPRLDRVRGRLDNFAPLAHGRTLAPDRLDETLFALPGLLDYTATLDRHDDHERISLDLLTLPGQETTCADAARTALDAWPELAGLRRVIRSGSTPDASGQPGKRTLKDMRQ